MAISNISYQGAGAGIIHAYPYTDFHEMNLDWILTTYQDIVNKLNETIDWANNHQTEYEEAIARLTAVENEIETFEAQITAAFNKLQADLEADFAEQKAELDRALQETRAQVDAAIIQMQNEVTQQLADFVEEFYQLKAEVQAEVNRLLGIINNAIEQLNQTLEANNQYVFAYVENRLEEFKDMIPDYEKIEGLIRTTGAAFCLSGAGPTLLCITRNPGLEEKLAKKLDAITTANWQMIPLHVDFQGAHVLSAE